MRTNYREYLPENFKLYITTIIKDEHDYIEEWIEYYLTNFHVDKFILYEDIDSKSHMEVVEKYGDKVVLLPALPAINLYYDRYYLYSVYRQASCLEDCYQNYKDECDFLFCIDPDEFLTNNYDFFLDELACDYFRPATKYIRYRWQTMTANGLIHKPEGKYSVVDTYTEELSFKVNDLNSNYKCLFILNRFTDYLINFEDVVNVPHGRMWWDPYVDDYVRNYPHSCLPLKHYLTKSFEEYMYRLYVKGEQTIDKARQVELFFTINEDLEDKKEELMKPYLEMERKYNVYDTSEFSSNDENSDETNTEEN